MKSVIFSAFQFIIASFLVSNLASAEPSPAAHELAQKFATEDQTINEPVNPSSKNGYEKELLEAAKAEAESRRRAAMVKATPKIVETAPAPTKPAQTELPAPPAAHTTPAKKAIAATPGQRIQIEIEAKIAEPAPTTVPAELADSSAQDIGKATVLVVLTDHTGKRRAASDPIICVGEVCYLSSGLEQPAKPVARTEALSTRNAITSGAAACKARRRCAFRNVTLQPGTKLQIVDLGIVRHDRREAVEANIDRTCTTDQGDLVCDDPRTAPDYRIWLVPEAVAATAGTAAIDAALANDLPEEDIARATDK